jgi:Rrf2 family protein
MISLKDIAARQQISLLYLEQFMRPLIAAGLVRSTRGPKGGVVLGRSPADIKLSEVVQLLEGSNALVECIDDPSTCSRSELCTTRDVWDEVKKAMNGVLESITLQDLVERQKRKAPPQEAMYNI